MKALRGQLYEAYASTHAGIQDATASALIYRRDIRPRLPADPRGCRILDIGCGQGELVRLLDKNGFDAHGVDISPEQVHLAQLAGQAQIHLGDFHEHLAAAPDSWDAVIATDVLEHLTKQDVLHAFESVYRALKPGGVFIARVPNAASPFGGHVMYGDITHETYFTARSVAQLSRVAGFASIETFACPPLAHGVKSFARSVVWRPISGLLKLGLATHTGELRGHITTPNLTFATRRSNHAAAGGVR